MSSKHITKHITKYPLSVIFFHSFIAILMIAALFIGWSLEDNRNLVGIHKSLGVTVLLLGLLRILNRIRVASSIPESVNAKGSMQYVVEKSVHGLLYIVMLGIPVSGWLLSNAYGYPASFFGLLDLPTLVAKNQELAHTLKEAHELGATVFLVLLVLHVAGALVHLIKEKHNVFKRMTP